MKQTLAHWLAHKDRADITIHKRDECLEVRVSHGVYREHVVYAFEGSVPGDVGDDHGALDAADAIIGVLDDIVDAIDDNG